MKFVGQQLYVVFGPVFDYDADGLADTDFTTARLTALFDNTSFTCCIEIDIRVHYRNCFLPLGPKLWKLYISLCTVVLVL